MRIKKLKDLPYWKNKAEEDYISAPISVLKYISELESKLKITNETFKPIPVPEDRGNGKKLCPKCGIEKHKSEFSKSKRFDDGHNYTCKPCQRILTDLRKRDNAEYQREYNTLRKTRFDYSDPYYSKNSKVCPKCGVDRPLLSYSRDAKGVNGLKRNCNDCRKPYYKTLKNETYDPSVYRIINKITGEVLYVGETITPELRKQKHFSGTGKLLIGNSILSGELNVDDLVFEIIERVEDKTERLERETYWILKENPKYNIRVK